jgi:hypothetical protein
MILSGIDELKATAVADQPLKRDDIFSSIPRLPGWSFLRLICEGILPPPLFPVLMDAAGAVGLLMCRHEFASVKWI